jgi:hypothetical protein
MYPRIRIHTKMSWICNTACHYLHSFVICAIIKFSKAEKNIRKKKTSETISSKQYWSSAKN